MVLACMELGRRTGTCSACLQAGPGRLHHKADLKILEFETWRSLEEQLAQLAMRLHPPTFSFLPEGFSNHGTWLEALSVQCGWTTLQKAGAARGPSRESTNSQTGRNLQVPSVQTVQTPASVLDIIVAG